MFPISLHTLRRDEILWELLLHTQPNVIPDGFISLSTDKLLKFSDSTVNMKEIFLGNVYKFFSILSIQSLLSPIFDLHSRFTEIIKTTEHITQKQFLRLKSRTYHFVNKLAMLLVLYPGCITEQFLLVESLLYDILVNVKYLDKSVSSIQPTTCPALALANTPPVYSGNTQFESDTGDTSKHIPSTQRHSVMFTNDLPLNSNTQHVDAFDVIVNKVPAQQFYSFENTTPPLNCEREIGMNNLSTTPSMMPRLTYKNVPSPLIQLFSDSKSFSENTFCDVLDFLKILVQVIRKVQIWQLMPLHAFQVLSQYTVSTSKLSKGLNMHWHRNFLYNSFI